MFVRSLSSDSSPLLFACGFKIFAMRTKKSRGDINRAGSQIFNDVSMPVICPTRLGKNPAHFWDQGVGFGL
jgi:hypothetical protein